MKYKVILCLILSCNCIQIGWSKPIQKSQKIREIGNVPVEGFYLDLPSKYTMPNAIQILLKRKVQGNNELEGGYQRYVKSFPQLRVWLLSKFNQDRTDLLQLVSSENEELKINLQAAKLDTIAELEEKYKGFSSELDKAFKNDESLSYIDSVKGMCDLYRSFIMPYYKSVMHQELILKLNEDIKVIETWNGK